MNPIRRFMPLAFLALAVALFATTAVSAQTPTPYNYETRWFTVPLDHFNFAHMGEAFQLRYLYNDEFYKPGGPIFFYTGNEGAIDVFCNNTGFMWDIAPEFNALLVFAEHRYYGESLPYGTMKDSYTNEHLVHLSAEQALADYALLLGSLKSNMSLLDTPVISFGGSYGGMLSAWFRFKYPHVVAGSIAASAPIWWFNNATTEFDPKAYSRIASDDFRAVSQSCFDGIAKSWDAMKQVAAWEGGLKTLENELGLCSGTLQKPKDVEDTLFPWLSNVYSTLPMADYPYPTTFLGPLPGNPVNVACSYWPESLNQSDPIELLHATRASANLFFNYSGEAFPICFNLSGPALASLGDLTPWDYQSCTEMILPIGQYGPPSDLFYVAPWDLQGDIDYCQQTFGATPQARWVSTFFGSYHDWQTTSNIVFSNGNLDPWHGGGVLNDLSPTVVSVWIDGGAHHLDLRASDPLDPPSVIEARRKEVEWIRKFIQNPNPQAGVDGCDKNKLSTQALVITSAATTLGAVIIFAALYHFCCRKKKGEVESRADYYRQA